MKRVARAMTTTLGPIFHQTGAFRGDQQMPDWKAFVA